MRTQISVNSAHKTADSDVEKRGAAKLHTIGRIARESRNLNSQIPRFSEKTANPPAGPKSATLWAGCSCVPDRSGTPTFRTPFLAETHTRTVADTSKAESPDFPIFGENWEIRQPARSPSEPKIPAGRPGHQHSGPRSWPKPQKNSQRKRRKTRRCEVVYLPPLARDLLPKSLNKNFRIPGIFEGSCKSAGRPEFGQVARRAHPLCCVNRK